MRTTLLAGILLLSGAVLFGQTVSGSKDITVFPLSANGTGLPQEALSGVDLLIRNVFVNLGTYRVTRGGKGLTQDDVAKLVEQLKEYTSTGSAPSHGAEVGALSFSSSEMRRLAGSFLVVVPVVASYTQTRSLSGGFTVELDTGFTFIDGARAEVVDHTAIKTVGVGRTALEAAREALDRMDSQLVYTVRALPGIRPAPRIVEVGRSTVLIEVGRSSGVHVGDEFAIISSRELPSGRTVTERTGLLLVKEVKKTISYARVIYARSRPKVGDRLKRLTRIGVESSLYSHVIAASRPTGTTHSPVFTVGTLHTVTRGLYNLRPVLGFEVPLAVTAIGGSDSYPGPGLPFNVFAGAELNWRLWRFDITPLAALGVGGTLPLSTAARLSVSLGGGLAQVSVSYLITARVKAFADVGLEEWLPLASSSLAAWGGFYGGVGVTVAY